MSILRGSSANGKYWIYVMDSTGNVSDGLDVTLSDIKDKAAGLKITPTTSLIKKGATATLSKSLTSGEASSYTWASSNTSVATVNSSGVVTAVAAGSATISCTATNYDGTTLASSQNCTVTVVDCSFTQPNGTYAIKYTNSTASNAVLPGKATVSAPSGTTIQYQWGTSSTTAPTGTWTTYTSGNEVTQTFDNTTSRYFWIKFTSGSNTATYCSNEYKIAAGTITFTSNPVAPTTARQVAVTINYATVLTSNQTVTYKIGINNAVSGTDYTVSGNVVTALTNNLIINVSAKDTSGKNQSTASYTVTNVQTDSTPPDVTAEPDPSTIGYDNIYVDSSGNKAVIPKGFTVSQVDGENNVDTGLVVIAPDSSEFVWVPINSDLTAKGTTKIMAKQSTGDYAGTDSNGRTNYEGVFYQYSGEGNNVVTSGETRIVEPQIIDNSSWDNGSYRLEIVGHNSAAEFGNAMQEDYNEMIASVKQYGGFYIGRYESSISGQTVKSIKNVQPMADLNWHEMYKRQKDYASSSKVVKSSMIWGSQWFALINWALTGTDGTKVFPESYQDDAGWHHRYLATHQNYSYDEILTRKTTEIDGNTYLDRINNVYDLEGNVNEWSLAKYGARCIFGGSYNNYGFAGTIGLQVNANGDAWAGNEYRGSRMTLYITPSVSDVTVIPTSLSENSITLKVTASDSETKVNKLVYSYKKASESSYTDVADTAFTASNTVNLTKVISGLDANTTYNIKVTAYNEAGLSKATAILTIKTWDGHEWIPIDENNEWQNTSNSTYKFVQSGTKWTSNNQNQDTTSATSTWTITLTQSRSYSFKYKVSSESNYDKLTIQLDSTTVANAISGSGTEQTYTSTLSAGNHTITATYSKDGSTSSGDDCGYIILEPIHESTSHYCSLHSTINSWNNTSNGTYKFTQSGTKWTSNNQNQNSTSATSTWTITLTQSQSYSFKYKVSSESNYDKLTIQLDSTTVANAISGSGTEQTYTSTLSAGNHTITATYSKDGGTSSGDDCGYIILEPIGNYFEVTAHTLTTTTTAATCTTVGSHRESCSICGYTHTETFSALGHIDSNNDKICDRCGGEMVYNITYIANNGTATQTVKKIDFGTNATILDASSLSFNAPSGYTFKGWNTSSDRTGTDYSANSTYSANTDLTLYAKWYCSGGQYNSGGYACDICGSKMMEFKGVETVQCVSSTYQEGCGNTWTRNVTESHGQDPTLIGTIGTGNLARYWDSEKCSVCGNDYLDHISLTPNSGAEGYWHCNFCGNADSSNVVYHDGWYSQCTHGVTSGGHYYN